MKYRITALIRGRMVAFTTSLLCVALEVRDRFKTVSDKVILNEIA